MPTNQNYTSLDGCHFPACHKQTLHICDINGFLVASFQNKELHFQAHMLKIETRAFQYTYIPQKYSWFPKNLASISFMVHFSFVIILAPFKAGVYWKKKIKLCLSPEQVVTQFFDTCIIYYVLVWYLLKGECNLLFPELQIIFLYFFCLFWL